VKLLLLLVLKRMGILKEVKIVKGLDVTSNEELSRVLNYPRWYLGRLR
jgi:hypothetical protein